MACDYDPCQEVQCCEAVCAYMPCPSFCTGGEPTTLCEPSGCTLDLCCNCGEPNHIQCSVGSASFHVTSVCMLEYFCRHLAAIYLLETLRWHPFIGVNNRFCHFRTDPYSPPRDKILFRFEQRLTTVATQKLRAVTSPASPGSNL